MAAEGSNEKFVEEILATTRKNCVEWCEILDTLGMDVDTVTKWRKTFKDSQEDVFEDLKGQALEVQKRLIESIEQLLKQAEKLCKMLHLPMPAYGSEPLSLFEEKKLLQKHVEKYEQQIEEKRKKVAGLEKRQKELCKSLGIEHQPLPTESLLTEKEMSTLLEKIESLEHEKYIREEKYINMREKLLTIVNELGVKPSLDLEKVVLSDDISSFALTDSNMKWLKEYCDSLFRLHEQTRAEITNEWEKLQNLWDLLQEDIQTRSEFRSNNVGCSLNTLETLKKEVKRCMDLKSANIQKFIVSLRSQMQDLWEKCHFSAEQRDNFEFFHETSYSDDLLTLHDMEINKLKKYLGENKEILSLIEKREELWNRMLSLEERSSAPDRFKNRGGQLLKEEKERNKLHKNIPEIETRIFQLAEEFKQRTGTVFTTKGLTVQDMISRSYDAYNEGKKLKLSARKQQRELATTPGKSHLNPTTSSTHNLATPCTPLTNTKRKLVVTLFSDAKRKKENAGLKSAPPKLQVNEKTVVRRYSRHSYDRKKRIQKIRRISNSLRKKKSSETSCNTTYRDFEKEMSSKQTCRSTFHVDQSFETLAVPLSDVTNACNTPKTLKKTPKDKKTPKTGLKLKPTQTKLHF